VVSWHFLFCKRWYIPDGDCGESSLSSDQSFIIGEFFQSPLMYTTLVLVSQWWLLVVYNAEKLGVHVCAHCAVLSLHFSRICKYQISSPNTTYSAHQNSIGGYVLPHMALSRIFSFQTRSWKWLYNAGRGSSIAIIWHCSRNQLQPLHLDC
jgi:hypothetical protein